MYKRYVNHLSGGKLLQEDTVINLFGNYVTTAARLMDH